MQNEMNAEGRGNSPPFVFRESMPFAGLCQDALGDTHSLCGGIGVNQQAKPVLSLAHFPLMAIILSVVIVLLDRIMVLE
jgi:hypothetical protein